MTSGCTDFTFEPDFGLCVAYDGCPSTSTDFCQDCQSGNLFKCTNCLIDGKMLQIFGKLRGIFFYLCDIIIAGACLGPILSATVTSNAQDCFNVCLQRPNCNWYTFFEHDGGCFLTTECDIIDDTCDGDCWHGERSCLNSEGN